MLPLLRILPVFREKSAINKIHTFETIHYIPARRQIYDTLEIDIRTVDGAVVPFQRGHVLVTLHFRRSA